MSSLRFFFVCFALILSLSAAALALEPKDIPRGLEPMWVAGSLRQGAGTIYLLSVDVAAKTCAVEYLLSGEFDCFDSRYFLCRIFQTFPTTGATCKLGDSIPVGDGFERFRFEIKNPSCPDEACVYR